MKNKLNAYLMNMKEKYSYLVKPFFILLIIYLIAFYPIIRANFNYLDDLGRVHFGYRGWNDFSRFTSSFLAIFIHTSKYITDVSPLTQIIAGIFLAFSSVIILHLFKKNKKITFINIISVIPIGLSPYFLECISYKFDSPYMALSILSSILPFLFFGKEIKEKFIFSLATIVGTIIMCTTYQAASGIIPLVTMFLAFNYWLKKEEKEALNILVITAISYLVGLIIFKVFIMVPADSYASNSLLSIKELIPGFLGHLKTYYEYTINNFRPLWLMLIMLMVISFILVQVKQSKKSKLSTLIMVTVLIISSLFLTFGLYPALEKPLFTPRAMYGLGIFIALIGINITNDIKRYIPKLITIGLCWCFLVFSFSYGNALSEQKRYIDFRVQSVINELNQLEMMKTNTIKTIKFNGTVEKAPSFDNLEEEYKNIYNVLIPQTFGGNWVWNEYYFQYYFDLQNIIISDDDNLIPNVLNLIKDTMYYKIETNDNNYILITLK